MRLFQILKLSVIYSLLCMTFSCNKGQEFYTLEDFEKVPKIDAHFHYATRDVRFVGFADSLNFRLLSPNVDTELPIDLQFEVASEIAAGFPQQFAFFGTFSVDSFGSQAFARQTITRIKECMNRGAKGIKIWKNIGMELQDSAGNWIMIDNPAFEPVFQYLRDNHIPVIGHLGEPKDCWLPFEEMTDQGDRYYYESHPQYHMYRFPEMPSYEDQINARNHILEMYPDLDFIGAHLGSLEWNVDELAATLDSFPALKVDMAARIGHLKNQSVIDRDRVRNFMIRYQDRIIYATDMAVGYDTAVSFSQAAEWMKRAWLSDWIYLATDSVIGVQGLQLPRETIDRIYYKNAAYLFKSR